MLRTILMIQCETTGEFYTRPGDGRMMVKFPYPQGTRHYCYVPAPAVAGPTLSTAFWLFNKDAMPMQYGQQPRVYE